MSDAATLEREVKALLALHSIHPLRKAMIITYEDEEVMERDGLEIQIVPIWKWILEG